MCSACFPRLSLLTDASLSSTGSSRASSPASSVLSKRYDALPPSRRTSFPSFGGTPVALVNLLLDGRAHRRGLELVTRCSSRVLPRKRQDLPSSWGTTIVRLHMFQSDAGRTACTRPLRCSSVALGHRKAKAPTKGLSTLNSMAFELAAGTVRSMVGFAVKVTRHHARLASSCWSGSTGQDSHLQGFAERFQNCELHFIPLSQALLGANDVTAAS